MAGPMTFIRWSAALSWNRASEGVAGLRLQAACGRCRYASHRSGAADAGRQLHHVAVMRQHDLPGVIVVLDFVKRFLAENPA
jgi:hypothetical protein